LSQSTSRLRGWRSSPCLPAGRFCFYRILGTFRASNPALWLVVGGAAGTLALVLAVPGLRQVFRFAEVRPADALFGVAAGAASILWFELFKLWPHRPR
jgi:hypothetical protein